MSTLEAEPIEKYVPPEAEADAQVIPLPLKTDDGEEKALSEMTTAEFSAKLESLITTREKFDEIAKSLDLSDLIFESLSPEERKAREEADRIKSMTTDELVAYEGSAFSTFEDPTITSYQEFLDRQDETAKREINKLYYDGITAIYGKEEADLRREAYVAAASVQKQTPPPAANELLTKDPKDDLVGVYATAAPSSEDRKKVGRHTKSKTKKENGEKRNITKALNWMGDRIGMLFISGWKESKAAASAETQLLQPQLQEAQTIFVNTSDKKTPSGKGTPPLRKAS